MHHNTWCIIYTHTLYIIQPRFYDVLTMMLLLVLDALAGRFGTMLQYSIRTPARRRAIYYYVLHAACMCHLINHATCCDDDGCCAACTTWWRRIVIVWMERNVDCSPHNTDRWHDARCHAFFIFFSPLLARPPPLPAAHRRYYSLLILPLMHATNWSCSIHDGGIYCTKEITTAAV